MNKRIQILNFVTLIRGSLPDFEGAEEQDTSAHIITEIFTQGNCGNFAQALVLAFGGEVVCVTDYRHLVACIDGLLYDITGDVTVKYPEYHKPTTTVLEDSTNNYSFSDRGPIM